MSVIISELDLTNAPFYLNAQQTFMLCLKNAGVPIVGTLYLELDESASYVMTKSINGDILIKWS